MKTLGRLAPDFEGEIADDTPLADGGLCLDSATLVDLIAEIEEGVGVSIDEDQVSPDIFGTVGRLLTFLDQQSTSPS